MTVVDTSVWIDVLRGSELAEANWLRNNLQDPLIAMPDLVLCEVLRGLTSAADQIRVEKELSQFPVFDVGGAKNAVAAARAYERLRRRGFTVRSTVDCLIATFCIEHGHVLLHRDRDFDAFEQHLGLRVLHP